MIDTENPLNNQQDWDEDDYADDADEDDADIDAEAEEIARRLGEELSSVRKGDAIIITIKTILAFIDNDPVARSSLASAVLPNFNGENVLDMLNGIVASGEVSKVCSATCVIRTPRLYSLIKESASETKEMKGLTNVNLPHSNDRVSWSRISPTRSLDPTLVSSIRLQLHQVFLFAVTSSARGGQDMHALQEISGLIQVIGVLSGIQIGQSSHTNPQPFTPNSGYPWLSNHTPSHPPDIGTAVYPCLVADCKKTFSRLYNLRSHQRLHAVHRPFRCNACPASFARNHDLKRHVKLHDRKAWKCGGCHKIFSRRDAIKRHKNSSKARGPKGEMCLDSEVVEVELDEEEGEEAVREERRAKLWNGIATSQGNLPGSLSPSHEDRVEEGELQPSVISGIQSIILALHGLLQAQVGNALGTPAEQIAPLDPSAGQATLASVIARAQLQNLPSQIDSLPDSTIGSSATHASLEVSTLENHAHQGQSPLFHANTDNPIRPELTTTPSLSMYGLSDEQTKMLEEAIVSAAAAAQAQAEAEAALEEEEDVDEEENEGASDGHPDV